MKLLLYSNNFPILASGCLVLVGTSKFMKDLELICQTMMRCEQQPSFVIWLNL